MLLGVILMICFGFLRICGEKSKKSKLEDLGTSGSYAAAWDASPRRGQGAKMAPLGYAMA